MEKEKDLHGGIFRDWFTNKSYVREFIHGSMHS